MTTYIDRSALVFHGHNPPPDVAAIVIEGGQRRVITWEDVRVKKIERQNYSLACKRSTPVERVYRIWVAYYDMFLMGGWQAMMDRPGESAWIDRDRRWLEPLLMKLFPLVLPLDSERDQWELWKEAFAKRFKRRVQDRKPLGVAFVWWDGCSGELRRAERDCNEPAITLRLRIL